MPTLLQKAPPVRPRHGAMTAAAPTETVNAVTPVVEPTGPAVDGEMPVRFPVVVIEGLDTSDGRYLAPDSLSFRALPISLLAQIESAHGGDEPGPAVLVGRVDALERHPGPDVVSARTGEPFPEGTFVWSGTGAVSTTAVINGHNVADLVRRRFLRGVSVDLAGMDYEIVGEDGLALDPENPRRQLVTHSAEIAAVTLVPIPAFGDAYVELADEETVPDPITAEELPAGLMASAVPAWRSAEVGDECGLCMAGLVAAGEDLGTYVEQMRDRLGAELGNDEIAGWGENTELLLDLYTLLALTRGDDVTSQDVHDAWSVAIQRSDPEHRSLVPFDELAPDVQAMDDRYRDAIAAAARGEVAEVGEPAEADEPVAVTAAGDEGPHTGGMIALVPADPGVLVVDGGDPAEELHLTLAYLGDDVSDLDESGRAMILSDARGVAEQMAPVEAEIMGHAAFNPTGANDRDPCAVYLVSGPGLPDVKAAFAGHDTSEHPVFLPHVTAGYGLAPGDLSYVGPVVFDRLRVALGAEVTDFPLGDPAEEEPAEDDLVASAPLAAEPGDLPPDGAPDGEVGMPDAPQPCQFGDEPAVRSLLFDEGERYLPVCDDHEQQGRDLISQNGATVTDVVDIEQSEDDMPDTEQPDAVVASAAPANFGRTIAPTWAPQAVVAAAGPRPPADWFADPELDGPAALHVGEDGRIFGHLAAWDVPHIGMPNQRVVAPRSASGYAYFRTGAVLADDGTEIPVGHITLDTGHAGTELGHHAAASHYDMTGTVVADVAAGEDRFGIWVAGALRPNVDEATAAKLRAAALSGDWRRIGSSLELVAALAVNVPGFPVPRVRARVASGQPMALVAAAVVQQPTPTLSDAIVGEMRVGKLTTGTVTFYEPGTTSSVKAERFDPEVFADAIAARLEQRKRDGELSAAHAALVAELDDTPAVVAALLAEVDDSPQRFAELLAELDDGDDPELTAAIAELAEVGGTVEDFLSRMPEQLQREYLVGKVAARIRWGTPGAMTRCMAQARKHGVPERMRGGMCQNLKQKAGG